MTAGVGPWQAASATTGIRAGPLTKTGAVVSATVTSTGQLETFPEASVAVNVTGCVPSDREVPATGFCCRLIEPGAVQLSETVISLSKLGSNASQSAFAESIVEAGQ